MYIPERIMYIPEHSIKNLKGFTDQSPYIDFYRDYKPTEKVEENGKNIQIPKFFNNCLEKKAAGVALNIFQEIIHFFSKMLWNNYKTHFYNRVAEVKAKKDEKSKIFESLKSAKSELDLKVSTFLNKLHNENKKSVPLFSLPKEILNQVLLDLPVQDICRFNQTCTKANNSNSLLISNKIEWEKATRLPFDVTMSLEEQKKMYYEVGINYPPLVESLGGLKAIYDLPVIDIPDDKKKHNVFKDLKLKDVEAPIMRGKYKNCPFLVFCFVECDGPYLGVFSRNLHEDGNYDDWWYCSRPDGHQLSLTLGQSLFGNTTCYKDFNQFREKVILDRVKRLVNYEPIGYNRTFKGYDRFPRDAYLNDPGRRFLGSYEVKLLKPNITYITLWDPSKSDEENFAEIKERFPGC